MRGCIYVIKFVLIEKCICCTYVLILRLCCHLPSVDEIIDANVDIVVAINGYQY